MKSYASWPNMMAGVMLFAIPILSTTASASPATEPDALRLPSLTLIRLDQTHATSPAGSACCTLTGLDDTGANPLLIDAGHFQQPVPAADAFLTAGPRKEDRHRSKHTSHEEATEKTYLAYVLMGSGVAAGLLGALGLVTASSAPEGRKGTMVLLGLVGLGTGGGLFYWGYSLLDETSPLGATPLPSPVMVTYEAAF